jgi:hypothetical protein
MLSRLSFAVFVVAVVVAFLVARRTGWWGTVLGKAVAVVAVAVAPLLSAGWFFLRNRELTGNIAGSQPAWAAEHLHRVHTGFVETVTAPSFWTGVFSVFRGHFKVDGEWTWLMLLVPLLLAVVVGLVPALRRGRTGAPRTPLADALVAAMLVGVFVLIVFLQVRFTMQGGAAQARYGLPLMPVLAVAMAVGLTGFGRFVTPVLVTGWVAAATYGWFTILDLSRPAFTAPDTLTIARVAVVLAFIALAAVLVGIWVSALRPVPRADGPAEGPADEPSLPAEDDGVTSLRSRLARVIRRRPGQQPGSGPDPQPESIVPSPLVGFVVHGAGGVHPASAHIRVTGRMTALAASGAARVAQVDPVRWADGSDTAHLDAILVQRDAFPLAALDAAFARAAAEGTRIVAEVDDDFFTAEARERLARAEYDPDRLAAVDRLVRGADAVVVSTDPPRASPPSSCRTASSPGCGRTTR